MTGQIKSTFKGFEMNSAKTAIGVDLGGTKIALGRVDEKGHVLEMLRLETMAGSGPTEIIERVRTGISQLIGSAGKIAGVGIGVAGQVEPGTGRVIFAPNLNWHDVALGSELQIKLGLPVSVTNDVRAALLGEWLFGTGRGARDLLCIFVGTGIGGGIVSGGSLLEGCSNTAGEFGHITVDLHGPICSCGKRGCMEAIAGGWAISRRAKELVKTHPNAGAKILKMAGGNIDDISARAVIQTYYAGDPLAREIIDDAAEALAAGVTSLVNALNPCRIVLGGGIIEGMPEMVPRIEQAVKDKALHAAAKNLTISPSQLGNDAGMIGAAMLAMHFKP